ncbi:hypothetical protein [Amycolatopsis sp. WAC 01376]|uniref:DUF6907 domain-containing protein n=1 Tax=Amycolatopsis sp. WAC 01376 TaxID=2203195 RepID=UPI000F7B9A71|nr:hypothetical protein [Amycolatopsis sp. WAC 01376]
MNGQMTAVATRGAEYPDPFIPSPDQLKGTACIVCGADDAPEGQRIPVHHQDSPAVWACAEEATEACTLTGRPWWQTEPCPRWCQGTHNAYDQPADRQHFSKWESATPLSLQELDSYRIGDEYKHSAQFAIVYLQQPFRESAPKVRLTLPGNVNGFEFTVEEALSIAYALSFAVDLSAPTSMAT